MSAEALELEQVQEGIRAAFMCNHHGKVCIAFSDPAYAQADAIYLDKDNRRLHVVLHGNAFFISEISEAMTKAFEENKEALLTAIRADGSLLELIAPIEVGRA